MLERYALWGLLGLALIASVATDLKLKRIPDLITYPTAALALGLRTVLQGVGDLEHGLISGLVAAVALAGLFSVYALRKRIGWGDVKLLFGVGAAFGFPLVLAAVAFIALSGFLQAMVVLIWTGQVWATVGRLLRFKRKEGTPVYIPFAVAIALGCCWAMWWDLSNTPGANP